MRPVRLDARSLRFMSCILFDRLVGYIARLVLKGLECQLQQTDPYVLFSDLR
jgi:hypothetical protein